ncbi:MAG: threonine synthase [Verrucomicrobiota bacterium]
MFLSTRGQSSPLSFCDAFAAGLADDGGLFVPQSLPPLPPSLLDPNLAYPDLAFDFFSLFDSNHSPEELKTLITRSHENFDHPDNAAPLRQLDEHTSLLELFHGPTLAFKDFGLQIVGNLFEDQIARTGKHINVLGATSGDTGSAAIHGLANKNGVNVFILYPKGRISDLQERQMTCTDAPNIFPICIEGSFDDAQNIVKELFNDLEFKTSAGLSAVNSINIARILAQSVYYISAFNQLPTASRAAGASGSNGTLDFVVPTGNFGNIFAGWLASKMGLPVDRFTIATNQNDLLCRLFNSGVYQPAEVHPSLAPSMDIQVASNFERFLYYMLDEDAAQVAAHMNTLKSEGNLTIPEFNADTFHATRATDEDIFTLIKNVHDKYEIIVDPHTACGFQSTFAPETKLSPETHTVILATAHPAKFPDTIEKALGTRVTHPILEALKEKSRVRHAIPPNAAAIKDFIQANQA